MEMWYCGMRIAEYSGKTRNKKTEHRKLETGNCKLFFPKFGTLWLGDLGLSVSDHMTDYLIRMGRLWIKRQRQQHHPRGTPLPPEPRQSLSPLFLPETLDSVRIVRVPLIENPAFYGTLLTSRFPRLIDFRKASGITFIDTILLSDRFISGPPSLPLLFHEIVHVVQYSLLGVDEFARRYVLGWAEQGYRYASIPLEEQASRLTAAFGAGTITTPVEQEVERTMPP